MCRIWISQRWPLKKKRLYEPFVRVLIPLPRFRFRTTVNKRDYYCSIALFSHKKRQDLSKNQKKRNKGGTKMLKELLEKNTNKKKVCFMFWWIVGFDITQIIIQLLEKIEYFSTLPLTSYCSLLVVEDIHIDNQIKITLKNKSDVQICRWLIKFADKL